MMKKRQDRNKKQLYAKLILTVISIILITYFVIAIVILILQKHKYIDIITSGMPPMSLFAILVVGALTTGLILTMITVKIFLQPINRLSDATKKVAEGDFSVRIDSRSREPELDDLVINFNKMVSDLRNIETLKTDFIANVSHEFKTPLATIQGYSTLLQDDCLSAEERKAYTQYIIDATKQLSNLIGNILKISKLENRECDLERSSFDIDEQIRQAILFMETQWTAKSIDLNIELVSAEVEANEELLMQVWLNVIGNAIKFSNSQGRIDIFSEIVGEEYKVTVRDYGCGMSEETLKRVFEKFYQGDNSRGNEGNGLGLALVKKILDLTGGSISVESEFGKGSAFTVSVPVKQVP